MCNMNKTIYFQAWRLGSYLLVHVGWVHICSNILGKHKIITPWYLEQLLDNIRNIILYLNINIIFIESLLVQLFLGIPLEIVHGPLRLSVLYLAGAVTGSLLTSVTDSHSYLAGASGGVYALLLAHLPTIIMNCKEMKTFVEWIVR